MKHKLTVVTMLLLALSISASAADVSGKWKAQVPGRNTTRETTFDLKADGDKLTGTMVVEGASSPVSDGKVSGDTVIFTVTTERGKYNFTGKVSGDEIQFKREGGQGQPREFTAKRAR